MQAGHGPRLIWDHVPHTPVAVICRLGVHYLSMSDASLDGVDGIIIDLTFLFGQRLVWHTDNIGAYREYINNEFVEYLDGAAIGPSKNSSDGESVSDSSKESMECVD